MLANIQINMRGIKVYYRWSLATWMDRLWNVALPRLYALPCLHSNSFTNYCRSLFIRMPYGFLYKMANTCKDAINNISLVAYSGFHFRHNDLWMAIDDRQCIWVILLCIVPFIFIALYSIILYLYLLITYKNNTLRFYLFICLLRLLKHANNFSAN